MICMSYIHISIILLDPVDAALELCVVEDDGLADEVALGRVEAVRNDVGHSATRPDNTCTTVDGVF